MADDVSEILIPADRIAARVRELAADLARAYAGRPPVLVAIMKGSFLFLADLVRAWPESLDMEFVSAESYDGIRAGALRVTLPHSLGPRVAGQPVLVIDDIYDTGRTLAEVCRAVDDMGPAEVRTLVLLLKHRDAANHPDDTPPAAGASTPRTPDWVGFEVPDRFVVGYGLDHCGQYRNLPHIAVLRQG